MSFRVLVLGDVMLDLYRHVETRRKASEASIPVWDEVRREHRLGGAANVANNVRSIGGDEVSVTLAGIHGPEDDEAVSRLLLRAGVRQVGPFQERTMTKERVVAPDGRFLFRLDNFRRFDDESVSFFEESGDVSQEPWDALIVSDYDAGTVTEATVKRLAHIPLRVVDTKRADLRLFEGFDVLKLNEDEHSRQVSSLLYPSFERMFGAVVVTKGAQGAELRQSRQSFRLQLPGSQVKVVQADERTYLTDIEQFPVEPAKAVDVTGCGDTFTAALTFSLLKTKDLRMSVRFANSCARRKVQMFGTGAVKGE